MYDYNNLNRDMDAHRLQSLKDLASEYNRNHSSDSAICFQIHDTAEKLIFALWNRSVKIGLLGFGYPYDKDLKSSTRSYDDGKMITTDLKRILYI